jgi:hypothetical protein
LYFDELLLIEALSSHLIPKTDVYKLRHGDNMRDKSSSFHEFDDIAEWEVLSTYEVVFGGLIDGSGDGLDFLVFEQLLDGLVVLLDEGISWGFEKF